MIGEGQNGKVFLARNVFKDKADKFRNVAIKVLDSKEEEDYEQSNEPIVFDLLFNK